MIAAEVILNRIHTILLNTTSVGANVFRNHPLVFALDELPVINIEMGNNQILTDVDSSFSFLDWELEVLITITLSTTNEDHETLLNAIHGEIHTLLMTDREIGLGLTIKPHIYAQGADQPDNIDSDGSHQIIAMRINYNINYRTTAQTLE